MKIKNTIQKNLKFLHSHFIKILIGMLALLLSGCAGYVSPTTGPMATLHVPSDDSDIFTVHMNPYACTNSVISKSKTFHIPAGKLFTFTADNSEDNGFVETSCDITVSFIPDAGQYYNVDFYNLGNGCYIKIYEKLDGLAAKDFGANYMPVHTIQRHWNFIGTACDDALSKNHKNKIKLAH